MEEYDHLVPAYMECCANCAYWYGNRRIETFFERASIPSSSEYGECGGNYYRQKMAWNSSCHCFERQPGIKK